MREITEAELTTSLTPFEDAQAAVVNLVEPLAPFRAALLEALGLVSATDVFAPIDVPGHDNSSMDGYAIRTADIKDGAVTPLSHIATGAPLPDGADAVVPWEQATVAGDTITVGEVTPGQYIRTAGHDIAKGVLIVHKGERLEAVPLGILASVGIAEVEVIPRPKVAVLVTGDEVVAPGETLPDGAVYDVNSTLLPSLLHRAGAEVVEIVYAPDDRIQIASALHMLTEDADLVITTGGASVGERDWVRDVLTTEGELAVWRVALRPGKPFAAGTFNGTTVLTLPGNPGSVLACTHAFVTRAIRKMCGRDVKPAQHAQLQLSIDIINDGERTFLCPVAIDGTSVQPLIGESSQGLLHAARINGFLPVAPDSKIATGSHVDVELID